MLSALTTSREALTVAAATGRGGSTRDIAPVKVPVERSARSRARWPSTAWTAFSALAAAARARSATRIGWLRERLASPLSGTSERPRSSATALVTASSIEAGAGRPRDSGVGAGAGNARGSGTPGARPRRDTGVSNSGGAGSGSKSCPAAERPERAAPASVFRLKRTVSSRRTSSTPAPKAGGGPRSVTGEASAALNTRGRPSAPMNSDENSGISPSLSQA